MNEIKNLLARLSDQRGQTMAEYAVVLAVITVVIIASLQALSGAIGSALDAVTAILPVIASRTLLQRRPRQGGALARPGRHSATRVGDGGLSPGRPTLEVCHSCTFS